MENITDDILVYRITWLRAKNRFERWEEEEKLVSRDMECTINWFNNSMVKWNNLAEEAKEQGLTGHSAYAYQQADTWSKFKAESLSAFQPFINVSCEQYLTVILIDSPSRTIILYSSIQKPVVYSDCID